MKLFRWAALGLALVVACPVWAQRLDGIAAVVNDDVILQSDVEEQLYLFLMSNHLRPDSMMVDSLRRQVLDKLIDDRLMVSEAKRQGLTVTDAEVNKQVEEAITETKQRLGGEQAFREQLAKENMTEEKLREKYRGDMRNQILFRQLIQKQMPKRQVTQAEAEAYFKANTAKFPRVPAELKMQVIQIPATPDSVVDAKAKTKAAAARKRIVAGERFAKVAAEVSDDPNTARSGGDLGFLGRDDLDAEIETAAYTQKVGEVSHPVHSPFGWHLIEVLERDSLKTRAGKDSVDRRGARVVEVHLRHILVRVPVGEDDAQRAQKLAESVRARAVKGEDFGGLVKRYSRYSGRSGDDGDLGFVSLGTLQPNIRAGLDTVPVGGISDVLVNPVGFNIFKVNDRKPEREYKIEEIKDELPEVVAEMKQRERLEEMLKGLRAKAHIEIKMS